MQVFRTAAAFAALLVHCTAPPDQDVERAPDDAAPQPALLFRAQRTGETSGLYLTADGGETIRQLVAEVQDVLHYDLHPSGSSVAYVTDPNDTEMFELHVLELETGVDEEVGKGIRFGPTWSVDGTRLAYMNHRSGWQIELTSPALTIQRPPQSHIGGDGAPAWFPSGERIVFQSNRTGRLELFTADTRTGVATQLTETDESESRPRVSPDGQWIAYERASAIWIMRSDGTGARRLRTTTTKDLSCSWAPNSERLAVTSEVEGNVDIYLIEHEKGAAVRLTRHAALDDSPSWSPTGDRLAFVSERDGNAEIYTIAADGTGLRRITTHPGRDRSPTWLPIR